MSRIVINANDGEILIKAEPNSSLMEICDEYSTPILFGCREASCGTCLIEVNSGINNLSPVTVAEQELLSLLAPDTSNARLACQCIVTGDIQVTPADL